MSIVESSRTNALNESFFNQAIRILDNPDPRVITGSEEGTIAADMATRLIAQGLVASTVEYVQADDDECYEGPVHIGRHTRYNPASRNGAGVTIQSEVIVSVKNRRKPRFDANNLAGLEVELTMYQGKLPQPATLRTKKTPRSRAVLQDYIFGSSIATYQKIPKMELFTNFIILERESRALALDSTREESYPEEFDIGNARQIAFWLAGSTIINPIDITQTDLTEMRALSS